MKAITTIMALAASASMCFAEAPAGAEQNEAEEASDSEGYMWRVTVGGFARGSMRIRPEGFDNKETQGYGADVDVLFNAWENDDFRVWTGLGFGWMPNQKVYDKHWDTAGLAENQKMEMQYGEMRFLLVPEWQATESLAFGVRLGATLDWVRCRNPWSWSWGGFGGAGTETYSKFMAQGVAGLQATYMFTETIGLYALVDARMGNDVYFKKNGERMAKLDMTGWYAGFGLVTQF